MDPIHTHTGSEIHKESIPHSRKKISAQFLPLWLFVAMLAITPLFIWPIQYMSVDLIKALIIAIGVLASGACLIWSHKGDMSFPLPPKHILWAGVAIILSVIVSTVASGHIDDSLFGQGFELNTGSFIVLSLIAGYMAYVITLRDVRKVWTLYVAMVAPFVFITLFQVLRFIDGLIGTDILTFYPFKTLTATTFGHWYSLGIYAMLVLVCTLLVPLFFELSRRMKIVVWSTVGLSVIMLCAVQYRIAWQVGAITALLIAYVLYRQGIRSAHSPENSWKKRISWPLLAIALVCSVCAWKGDVLVAPLVQALGTQYAELVLPWKYTLEVGTQSLKEYPLFGVGPNHFADAYIQHKPVEINATPVWGAEFGSGVGVIPTFMITQGVLGVIVWLAFLISVLLLMLRVTRKLPEDPTKRFLIISSAASTLLLMMAIVMSTPSHTIVMYAFVCAGIFASVAVQNGYASSRTYTLALPSRTPARLKKFGVYIPHMLIAVCVIWVSVYIQKTVAFGYFGTGIRALAVSGNPDAAYTSFVTANTIDFSDIYLRAQVEALLVRVNMLSQTDATTMSSTTRQDMMINIVGTINDALAAARSAIDYSADNYYNHLSQARIFEVAAQLGMTDAVEGTVKAYTKAIEINPQNPQIHLNLARFYAEQRNFTKALASAGDALRIKPNYLDALFLVAQVQVAQGNISDALVAARMTTEIDPANPLSWFQYGFLHYSNKSYKDAISAFEKSLSVQGDYANAQYFLGLSYVYENRRQDAIKVFKGLVTSNPNNQEVKSILANLEAGRSPFADTEAAPAPEKRSKPPIEEDDARE